MPSPYSESETEQYYDHEDAVYRALWDKDGSVHWGLFEDGANMSFLEAGANLNKEMARRGQLDKQSEVIDVGCGSGTTAIALCESYGCKVTGVDLSGVRIANAIDSLDDHSRDVQEKVDFKKGSATDLPIDDESFTHAWSQATIYHVPDKVKVLEEVYRVLKPGGIFVFDDLIKPQPNISEKAQKFVYERLLYDTDFSFESYHEALEAAGFTIVESEDISRHLKTSYLMLSDAASKGNEEHRERFAYLAEAYEETAAAVDNRELGWAMFVCRK
ncbi:MAG: class I SAM-dependent methyltransferase [Chloroflexi bacterium]|nr:class I SAM-dependent methyltransferase [Chloroflexota bacterium]